MKYIFILKRLLPLLLQCFAVTAFAQVSGKQIFTYTGADQTFTVPANVYQITVKLWGAGGAGGRYVFPDLGGGGGYATATLSVSPGQQYTVVVGGAGLMGAGPGAYGGGGAKANGLGGRGGGRSVLIDAFSNEVITAGAGGGGGGGNGVDAFYGIARGGAGGGLTGGPSAWDPYNGGPGTQTDGGAAGHGPNQGPFGSNPGGPFYGGSTIYVENGYNGSGGGGYFGGGSGADNGDGGGGGGSSHVPVGGSTIGGTNNVPGNPSDPDYQGTVGYGGSFAVNGNPGLVVISWGKQYTLKQVFNYTGADQFYTVPANVHRITVKLWGAGGAGGQYSFPDIGGGGGFATAFFAVNPGDHYTVIVGGAGLTGAGPGAYGGGGAKANGQGGRGGGRSALRDAATDELITAGAGGGGGGGNGVDGPYGIARGGAGGGLTGGPNYWYPNNGGAGTQTAGGDAGHAVNQTPFGSSPGGAFFGGSTAAVENGYNGSGGGGYFGGGSGNDNGDGGGGGGSSYVPASGSTIAATDNVPANIVNADYNGSAGYGGAYGVNGNPGLVVIIAELDCNLVPISVTGNLPICAGQKITLFAHGAKTYTWQPGNVTDTALKFAPLPDSCTYVVTGQDANGCLTDTITDSVKVKPVPSFLTNALACSGNILSSGVSEAGDIIKWKKDGVLVARDTTGLLYTPRFATIAGNNGYGAAANQLALPTAVCVDKAGNIYAADADNNRVQKWVPGATAGITVAGGNGAGTAANQLQNPTGVYVDTSGNIFIADSANARVQKWSVGATAGITVAGGNGTGNGANQLAAPAGIFVDAAGTIFVTDMGNNRVQKWLPGATSGVSVAGGGGAGNAATQLQSPGGVFVDSYGDIYVADAGNNRVEKWLPGATAGIMVAGGNGKGNAQGQLSNPVSVAVDINGYIFVSEAGNNRVSKWIQGNKKSAIVVSNDSSNGYGITQLNRLNSPAGIAIDSLGNVYIADKGNNRVYRISAATHNTLPSSGPGVYTFTASSPAPGCSVSGKITVTSSVPVQPVAISGIKTGLCNKDSLNYTAASQADADNYVWALPTGFSIMSGQGTKAIVVRNNYTSPFNDSICLRAGNSCGYSVPVAVNVSGTVPAKPSGISGTKTGLCNIASLNYTTGLQSNANSYTWKLPTGFSFVSGQGTNTISVANNYTSAFNDSVSVSASNACGLGLPLAVSVTGTVPAKASAFSGLKTDLCGATPLSYGVAGQTNASMYNWVLPSGFSFISGQGTNNITVANIYAGSFNDSVQVSAANACGSGLPAAINVKSAFTLVTSISGSTSVTAGQTNVSYSYSSTPLYAQYVWAVPKQAAITSGQGTTSIVVNWGNVSGNVTVKAINSCGDVSNQKTLLVTVSAPSTASAATIETEENGQAFFVYPNPAINMVTAQFTSANAGRYQIELTDAAGRPLCVKKGTAFVGINTVSFDVEKMASGMYLLNLMDENGGVKHTKLIKAK